MGLAIYADQARGGAQGGQLIGIYGSPMECVGYEFHPHQLT